MRDFLYKPKKQISVAILPFFNRGKIRISRSGTYVSLCFPTNLACIRRGGGGGGGDKTIGVDMVVMNWRSVRDENETLRRKNALLERKLMVVEKEIELWTATDHPSTALGDILILT